jgi:hypothetical protein
VVNAEDGASRRAWKVVPFNWMTELKRVTAPLLLLMIDENS